MKSVIIWTYVERLPFFNLLDVLNLLMIYHTLIIVLRLNKHLQIYLNVDIIFLSVRKTIEVIIMSIDVNLEVAKKVYPLLNLGDHELYQFVEEEFGIKKPNDFKEYKKYFNMISELKANVRKLYNPLDDLVVGDGITLLMYSDNKAGTVIKRTNKSITMQLDNVKLLNKEDLEFVQGGYMAHCSNQNVQQYSYTRNPNGGVTKLTRRKDGSYRVVGCNHVTQRYNDAIVGRHEFYDYNF